MKYGKIFSFCDDVCYNLHFKDTNSHENIKYVYSHINRITTDDRKKYIEKPLAVLNAMFERSIDIDAFLPVLMDIARKVNARSVKELSFAAFFVTTSRDCKQYVPIKALRSYYDTLIASKEACHRFSVIMRLARDPGNNDVCPIENRQNALFKREVMAMKITPDQKQAMFRRYTELGLDKIIVFPSPVRSATSISILLAMESGVRKNRKSKIYHRWVAAAHFAKKRLEEIGKIVIMP